MDPFDHYFVYLKPFYVENFTLGFNISRDEGWICFGKIGLIFWEKRSIFEAYE
jgi:hypothetical protein